MVDESPLAVEQEMAKVIFNLSQTEGLRLTARVCVQLKRLYDRWITASAPRIGARPQPKVAPREDQGAAPAPSREEVWLRAWCTVSGAVNYTTAEGATRWADKALEAFDARFPPK